MLGKDVSNMAGDVWAVWTSPLNGKPRDWLLAAGGIGVAAAISPIDDDIDRWAVRHQNDNIFDAISPFREGGDAFSGRTVTPLAVGALVISLVTKSQNMQDGVFGCMASYLASYGIRHYVSYPLIARVRPDSSRGVPLPAARQGDQYEFSFPGKSEWGQHSIPGGHVANTMTCASFLTKRFEMGVFEPLPWLIVGSVATARVVDRRHWASDQVIGMLLGYAVGKEVAIRSLRRRDARAAEARVGASGRASETFLEPAPGGVRFGWRSDF